jgi:hypothetical protein
MISCNVGCMICDSLTIYLFAGCTKWCIENHTNFIIRETSLMSFTRKTNGINFSLSYFIGVILILHTLLNFYWRAL